MKIKKQWVSWEEFEKIQGGSWTPAPHATKHHSGGADPLDFASITGFGTYLDQAVKQASSPTFVTAKLTALTDGYVPYHVNDATGLANSGIFWDSGNSRVGINLVDPDEDLEVAGNIKATAFLGNIHWDYITNEPLTYPPEYHYHVGKDIVSLHLVDLDDVEADDIFDVLTVAVIHGQGNYDWWGTWDTTAGAGTSAWIKILAGDDKLLRLTDNSGVNSVKTVLSVDAPHYMVTGVVQFQIREDAWGTVGIALTKGGARNMEFLMIDGGVGARKFWFFNGTAEVDLATAYIRNQWYTVRIHYDCVARAAVIFIDNTFVKRTALNAAAVCDYVDAITIETDDLDTGYVVDINNLKIFNLTI